MKKITKFLSALLALIMLVGSFSVVAGATIDLYDENGKKITGEAEVDYTVTLNQYLGYDGNGLPVANFKVVYNTPQEKLASMEMMWEKYGYQLWVDHITGEVATVKVSTGEILFTNPWNVGDNGTNSLKVKKELLSQIIVNYVDNDAHPSMSSCAEAASRGQINVEYIKTGVRVEYSIGREQTRMLVPKLINAERYRTKILGVMREALNEEVFITVSDGTVENPHTGEIEPINTYMWPVSLVGQTLNYYDLIKICYPDFDMNGPAQYGIDEYNLTKLDSYYILRDPSADGLSDITRQEMETAFPITKKMAVYAIDPKITTRELNTVENLIKTYIISYTYEELDYDHELTEYVGVEKAPPLFKMALEYSIDHNGLSVRLPANGIRFDESLYQLQSLEMLPYMGAGMNDKNEFDGGDGYTFFPDGSGAIFEFDQLNSGPDKIIKGKVYGEDYAYHSISATHQEVIRYPAFGIVENYSGPKTVTDYTNVVKKAEYAADGTLISPTVYGTKIVNVDEKKGFLAVIEEGDALAELASCHLSATSVFNTVKMIYYPRPQDSYNMSNAISVGSNTTMTVVSDRKYVGSYTVRYFMLTDDNLAEENNLSSYYECSWMGMALAYRNYLEGTNVLDRLEENEVDDDIPLYLETFGTLMTTEKFMSVPMDVMTPLTTFEDIMTMYTELSDGIEASMNEIVESGNAVSTTKDSAKDFSNINFKLTGYANGGMYSTVPYHLNWESAVGGASGFEKLVEQSKENGFGIFPDFDFVYINTTDVFDGVNLKQHAVKTIDNRYTSRREYSATYQTYVGYFQLAIAPSCFERFVTKLASNYLKYNPTGISVSTLGTDLNSDFDEDDPLNREDSKKFTVDALEMLSHLKNDDGNELQIMTDGGNSYTWRYINHIVNMPLNSSRYNEASNSVPFMGVVLHGYVQFAGTPINEEGDIESAMLKAIENGAGLYFTLAYQNAEKFKEDARLSKYFSVRYEIWKEDLVEMYVELNDLLSDLQTKIIIDHEFLVGDRVPDEDEIIADAEAKLEAEKLANLLKETEEAKKKLKEALETRHTPAESIKAIENIIVEANNSFISVAKNAARFDSDYISDCVEIINLTNAIANQIKEAEKTTYPEYAYKSAAAQAAKTLTEKLSEAITAANKLITDDATGKAEAESARETILSAAAAAGAKVVMDIVTEQVTNDSELIVNAVVSAATEKAAEVKSNATGENAEFVKNFVDTMIANITENFNAAAANTAIADSLNKYASAQSELEALIEDYTKAIISLNASKDAALNAGIEENVLNEILAAVKNFNGEGEFVSTDKYTAASDAADKAYDDAVAAYDAVEKTVTSNDVVKILRKLVSTKEALEDAEAKYQLAKAICEFSTFGATEAELKARDNAKKSRDKAEATYNNAEAALEELRTSSTHKTELDNLVNAYNDKNVNNKLKAYVDSVIKDQQSVVAALGAIDPVAVNLAELKAAYATNNNAFDANTSEYKAYINAMDSAYKQFEVYYNDVLANFKAASDARDTILATWKGYQDSIVGAEYSVRVNKAAYIASKFDLDEINELMAEEDATETDKQDCINAIAVLGKTVEELTAAYEAAAEADKAAAKLLVDIATVIEENEGDHKVIATLLSKAEANKTDCEKKIISYEQFYNTAEKEVAEAKERLNDFVDLYDDATEQFNIRAALEAKVYLFGAENFEAACAIVDEKIASINKDFAAAKNNFEQIKNDWTILKAEGDKYIAAKAEYLELLAKDVKAMTDDERTAYLTQRINVAYSMAAADNMMKNMSDSITAANRDFRVNYQLSNAAMTPLKQALDIINQEYAYAEQLLTLLKADPNASAQKIAEVEAIRNAYKAKSEEYSKQYDAINAEMTILKEGAAEQGLLTKNEKGEYVLVTKYEDNTNFINDTKKDAPVQKEVHVNTKYTCDDGSIVVVTYGGKDGNDSAAYRAFILNYNIFAVTVKYEGVEYTLEPYGYQIINY